MKSYQIRIALQGVKPIVRRRVIVPCDLDFAQLAAILLCAMGWHSEHEYSFRFEDRGMTLTRGRGSERFDNTMFSLQEGEKSAGEVNIDNVFTEGYSFWFDYDFGDGWEHGVRVEKIMDVEVESAMVSQFEGNCPPEDVGGPDGYENFLRIINDKNDPMYEEMIEWGEFQMYENYDVGLVNARLKALAKRNYNETAMALAYSEALFERDSSGANTAPDMADPAERGAYHGMGYRITETDFSGIDVEGDGDIPESFGPFCIWRVLENFDIMTREARSRVLQNPETAFGFLSIGQRHFTDLRSTLQGMRKEELEEFMKGAELPLPDRRGKPALVDAIYDFLADKNFFPTYMDRITDEDHLVLLNELMTSEEPYRVTGSDYPYEVFVTLRALFAVTSWWDGYDIVIIPVDEMREKYAEIIASINGTINPFMDRLDDCAKAATNLYGIVSLDEFSRIFASVEETDEDYDSEESISLDEMDEKSIGGYLSEAIKMYVDNEADYFISGNLLVSDQLRKLKKHDINGIYEVFSAYPRRILPRDDFLRYADWLYYEETVAHRNLRAFAERKVRAPKTRAAEMPEGFPDDDPSAAAEVIVREMSVALRMKAPFMKILQVFDELGYDLGTKDEKEEALSLLAEVNYYTRMWELGGATPEEAGERGQTGIPYKKAGPKIGRNEPCPCGSGKKYKNCCGRI